MKRLSPIRILRVFRPAPYLCALSRNGSPFPASSTTLFTTLFRNSQLPGSYCHVSRSAAQPRHSLGTARRRSFPPLNFHRARVRRNRGRLPSSRCIESARTHRARAGALPLRASDTTLGLEPSRPAADATREVVERWLLDGLM